MTRIAMIMWSCTQRQASWTVNSSGPQEALLNEGDGIPAELFQILKDDVVKILHSYVSKFGKLSSGHRTGKDQFSFPSQRRTVRKNVQTTIAHILHASKVMLKILQARISSIITENFQMYKVGLEKAEEPEIKSTFMGL